MACLDQQKKKISLSTESVPADHFRLIKHLMLREICDFCEAKKENNNTNKSSPNKEDPRLPR